MTTPLEALLMEIADTACDVVVDYGDRCDHPDDCDCSMGRLTRLSRRYDRLTGNARPETLPNGSPELHDGTAS